MMDNHDIKAGLRDRAAPRMMPREAFWSRFAARAGSISPARESAGWFWLLHTGTVRWSLGSVVGFAVVALLLFLSGPTVKAAPGVVRDLEIHAPYASVMILHGAAEEGTIVWIDGI